MEYQDGKEIRLGDIVQIDMKDGPEIARVVMLGSTYEHSQLEESFRLWVHEERILNEDSIVLEWVNRNPLAHNNPNFAPVGNYLFTGISEDLILLHRG